MKIPATDWNHWNMRTNKITQYWTLGRIKKNFKYQKTESRKSYVHISTTYIGSVGDAYILFMFQSVINSRHLNSISGILTSQLKHIWIQNIIFKQNLQSMCFWRKSRRYLGTSAYIMMGLSRVADATTTIMSVYFRRKHFAARSDKIAS